MKTLTSCALVLLLSAPVVSADDKKEGISISFSSEDSRTRLAPRHDADKARFAITSRNGATLLLTNDVVAVQLSEARLAKVQTKDDANFLEEFLAAGVRLAIGKSVEYPIANIRSAEVRNGVLTLTNDQGKPVFEGVQVDRQDVLRSVSAADAAKFVNAFRVVKSRR